MQLSKKKLVNKTMLQFPFQEKEEDEKERKEQEFVAQRKMEALSKMEGGNQELVYNQVSSSITATNAVS